ncbi:hypothetical protein D3C75_631200 [compost metagenome]
MQVVQVKTVFRSQTEGQRGGHAVALVLNVVPTFIVGFLAHQVQTEGGGFTHRLVDIDRATAHVRAADAGGGINAGVQTRLLADHIDRAAWRTAAIVAAGGAFDHFYLFGIEGIAGGAADVANAVHVNTV